MIVNYSNEKVMHGNKSIFLAGPTPREVETPSWRDDACRILEEIGFDGIVYEPEYSNKIAKESYDDQAMWEREALTAASLIIFWIPRDLPKMPAFTTNVEFGYWIHTGKILYGRPDDAEKIKYLDWLYELDYKKKPYNDLRELLVEAVRIVNEKCDVSCRVASYDDICRRGDYLIDIHPNNNVWVVAKENAIRGFNDNSRIVYVLEKDGIIISEATAYIKEEAFIGDITSTEELLSDNRVYLSAFRTDKEYRGKGYFSKLFKFMIDDLKSRGYTEACLGVEPCEITNMEIYFKYGFTNYIKTSIEYLPAVNDESLQKEEIVSFYYKKLD